VWEKRMKGIPIHRKREVKVDRSEQRGTRTDADKRRWGSQQSEKQNVNRKNHGLATLRSEKNSDKNQKFDWALPRKINPNKSKSRGGQ